MDVMQRVVSCKARYARCPVRNFKDQLILPDQISIHLSGKSPNSLNKIHCFLIDNNVYESLNCACLA